jgi:hypothetical protein
MVVNDGFGDIESQSQVGAVILRDAAGDHVFENLVTKGRVNRASLVDNL